MAQTIQHDQTAFFSELSTTGAPNISSTDASGSEHSNAVVSIPLVQNIRQVNPTIAISSILGCERDDRSRQRILIRSNDGGVSLCSAVLADDPAGLAFGETVLPSNALDRLPAPFGAYKFPEATSLSTCFSSDRSATRRLRRTFSRSRSFIRFA